jgi:hypothetical protein
LQQAESVLLDALHLRRSMSGLRRAMQACRDCPLLGKCAPMQEFNRQIDAAIDALALEWGLE